MATLIHGSIRWDCTAEIIPSKRSIEEQRKTFEQAMLTFYRETGKGLKPNTDPTVKKPEGEKAG